MDADEAVRLVSINAETLLKTSSRARSVLGLADSAQKTDDTGSANVRAVSSALKSADASSCSDSTVTVMSVGHERLPAVSQADTATDVAVENKSLECRVEEAVYKNQFHCDPETGLDQPSLLCGTQEPTNLLPTQSAVSVESDNGNIAAAISDNLVTSDDDEYCTMQSPPSVALGHPLYENFSAEAVGQETELLYRNIQWDRSVAVSSCASQTVAPACSDDAKADVFVASNCSFKCQVGQKSLLTYCGGKLLVSPTHTKFSHGGISNHRDWMESETESVEPGTGDPWQKMVGSSKTDLGNGQAMESAEVEIKLEPSEKVGEQCVSSENGAVLRKDMGSSVSRKPSRIVSFTTEDFDLFQSSYVAIYNNICQFFCVYLYCKTSSLYS